GDDLGARAHEIEQPRPNEIVVDDDVGERETPLAPSREEAGIAGSGADEEDAPAHRPRSSAAPAASIRSATDRPRASASAADPVLRSSRRRRPSGSLTNARRTSVPDSMEAYAAIGVLQSPPRRTRSARSAATAVAVAGSSSAVTSARVRSSPSRH